MEYLLNRIMEELRVEKTMESISIIPFYGNSCYILKEGDVIKRTEPFSDFLKLVNSFIII